MYNGTDYKLEFEIIALWLITVIWAFTLPCVIYTTTHWMKIISSISINQYIPSYICPLMHGRVDNKPVNRKHWLCYGSLGRCRTESRMTLLNFWNILMWLCAAWGQSLWLLLLSIEILWRPVIIVLRNNMSVIWDQNNNNKTKNP